MKETEILIKVKKKFKNGVLITGLPGIGLVGRIAGRYIVKKLKGKKIAELYSPHFPHHVIMKKNGGMKLLKNTFYYVKGGKRPLIFLLGDIQALNPEGQYEVAGKILDFCKKIGINEVITVGGYSTGKLKEKRRVFGVVTHKELIKKFEKLGVLFGVAKGSIVGAAGLLPALAKLRGMKGTCLMGETHGAYVDAKAAAEIVQIISKLFDLKIDMGDLEEEAKEGEKAVKELEEQAKKQQITPYDISKKDISYIR